MLRQDKEKLSIIELDRIPHNLKVARAALVYDDFWSWLIVTSTHLRVFFVLILKIWFGKLCKIRPSTAVTLRTFKSTYPCIEVNINSVEIKIGVNITLSFFL